MTRRRRPGMRRRAIHFHDSAAAHFDQNLTAALRERETRVERGINYARMAILGPGILLDAYTAYRAGILNAHYVQFVVPVVVVLAAYLGFVQWATAGARYRGWLKYLTVTVDFCVPLSYYAEVMRPKFFPSMSVDAAMGLLVLIVVIVLLESALRLDRWTIIYGTILGTASVVIENNLAGANFLLRIWGGPLVLIVGLITYWISGNVRQTVTALYRRERLNRFLPRELVEMVENQPEELSLGGKSGPATIMFTDIRGFTRYSENRRPEEVVSTLNEYFTVMSRLVLQHGGMIDKFVGDAIMAVFGAPVPRADDALRAVNCGLAMLSSLDALNDNWEKEGKAPIRIGIALHSGETVAGNVGSPERMDYTVIGDTVNLASRVEELNKQFHTSMLITEPTLQSAGDSIVGTLVGEVPIRGRENPIRLYTVGPSEPASENVEEAGVSGV